MRRAQPGVRQRQTTEEAGQAHILARSSVITGSKARRNERATRAMPFTAKSAGQRIGAHGNERLDQLRQRIQAGAGGDGGRQAVGELGIDQGNARQQERAAQAHLDALLGRGQDGIAGHFGARAGGGRDGDKGHGRPGQRLAAADDLEVIQRLALVGQQRGDRFAGVDGAAAAETDDEIAALATGQLAAKPDGLGGRLAASPQMSRSQHGALPGRPAADRRRPAGAGHHQGALPETGGQCARLVEGAGTEDDPRCGRKLEAHAV